MFPTMAVVEMPAIFIVAILLQCIVCLSESVVEPTGSVEEHGASIIHDARPLNCINISLSSIDYEMYPNSSVFVKKYNVLVNSSSYIRTNDTIAICKPPYVLLMDKFTIGFYFSFIIFMIHAQTPIVLSFGSLAKLFLTFVCSMPVATLASIGIASSYSDFIDTCVVVISMITFINVSTLGWMTLLTSNYILKFLESRCCIKITESKIVIKKLTCITQIGLAVATILSVHSFVMIMCDVVKKLYGVGFIDRIQGDKMLILFAPPISLFLIINFMLSLVNYGDYNNYSKNVNGTWEDLRLRHRKYFLYYMCSIFMWLFGSYALIFDYWLPWYCFVIVNLMLPIYYINELMFLENLTYETPLEYPVEDEGYTVHFKLGKKFVKLDFDYRVTEY